MYHARRCVRLGIYLGGISQIKKTKQMKMCTTHAGRCSVRSYKITYLMYDDIFIKCARIQKDSILEGKVCIEHLIF